jgi:NitT/TauT family transport system permease protein
MGNGSSLGIRFRRTGQFLFPFLVVGLLWEAAVRFGVFDPNVLPGPSALLKELYVLLWEKRALQHHLFESLYRLFAGYFLALAVGIVVGTLMGLRKTLQEMLSPALSLLIAVPTIAWVPVLLITMGLGNKTVITAIFLGGVFELIYSTMAGIRSVSIQQIHAAQIMGVRGAALFFRVMFPASLVYIMPAMRLSIGYCWRALVGGEMLSAMIEWGLGKMIYEARFWNNVKIMFIGLILIGILGVILDRLFLKPLERGTLEKWGMLTER